MLSFLEAPKGFLRKHTYIGKERFGQRWMKEKDTT
jgi:hypothetical protein